MHPDLLGNQAIHGAAIGPLWRAKYPYLLGNHALTGAAIGQLSGWGEMYPHLLGGRAMSEARVQWGEWFPCRK